MALYYLKQYILYNWLYSKLYISYFPYILQFKKVWDNYQTPLLCIHQVSLAWQLLLQVEHKYSLHTDVRLLQIKTVLTCKPF